MIKSYYNSLNVEISIECTGRKNMFTDTHFHFKNMVENHQIDGVAVLTQMAHRNCFLGLDIGTDCEDLLLRQAFMEKTIAQMSDLKAAEQVRKFLYFSAGIWPDMESIHNREQCLQKLRGQISTAANSGDTDILNRKIIALGECGLDHHWNPAGVDGRCESDFDERTYKAEKELFMQQLELARELNLPVIIHSRDAFEDTVQCIKEVGYNNGIIHCYSYGLEEAKVFLDLGWYISLSGSVTYNKKAKLEAIIQMIKNIPDDRLLCETDAPYLAPVPCRGQPNTPVLVEHTYNFVAQARGGTVEELSALVDKNCRKLFFGIE